MRDLLEPQPLSVATAATRVAGLTDWRAAALAFIAGIASILALAPFFAAPVLFITLPLLIWLIEARTRHPVTPAAPGSPRCRRQMIWRSAAIAWWFGFGFHLAGLYWIGHAFMVQADQFAWLLPFAITLLPAGLALFHALAGALTAAILCSFAPTRAPATRLAGLVPVLAFSLSISATEWLRGHIFTGFPWNILGYALTWPEELMQSAGLVGVYGLTLLTPIICATPLVVAAATPASYPCIARFALPAVVVLVLLVPGWLYGHARLMEPSPPDAPGIRLRLVQPSINQTLKWRADMQREIFNEHLRLSATNETGTPDRLHGITHVIWAEASMPFMPLESPEAIARIGELLPSGTRLLAGALRRELDDANKLRVFNSMIVFGDDGQFQGLYDKIHLVPFGEYLPFGDRLERLGLMALVGQRGGFSIGPSPRPVIRPAGLIPLSVLICYEAVFPGQIIQGSERPGLLLNITNDGWFGHSTGPYQHLHQARLRAVEEGLPLIRVANNGLTAVVDANGRIRRSLALDAKGVLDTGLPGSVTPPLFAHFGNIVFALMWLTLAGLLLMLRRTVRLDRTG